MTPISTERPWVATKEFSHGFLLIYADKIRLENELKPLHSI